MVLDGLIPWLDTVARAGAPRRSEHRHSWSPHARGQGWGPKAAASHVASSAADAPYGATDEGTDLTLV
jgi:hypothetical protein